MIDNKEFSGESRSMKNFNCTAIISPIDHCNEITLKSDVYRGIRLLLALWQSSHLMG